MEAAGALRAEIPNLGLSWGQCGCHRDPLVRPNSNSTEFRGWVVLNHSCYVELGLNWLQDPSLIPGSLELQLSGRRGFNPPQARGKIPEKLDIPSLDLRIQGHTTKPNQPNSFMPTICFRELSFKKVKTIFQPTYGPFDRKFLFRTKLSTRCQNDSIPLLSFLA